MGHGRLEGRRRLGLALGRRRLPEEIYALWDDSVSRSRAAVEEALAGGGGMDQLAQRIRSDGTAPSLRWLVVHMIEEYARHNGHADLIRESVDGLVGE